MKLPIHAVTHLAECGYVTLQVPEFSVSIVGAETLEELPDEWFWRCASVRGLHVPTVGREDGFVFLSPAGWAANKDAIRAAWKPTDRGKGIPEWADFEAHAAGFFAEVRAGAKKRLADEKAKNAKRLAQLEAAVEAIE